MKIVGVGVDIVLNQRFSRILTQSYAPRFLARVLNSPKEFQQFENRKGLQQQSRYLASRWAYKEALVKATGDRSLVFSQVWLAKTEAGRPSVVFEGENQKIVDRLGIKEAHVSISHEEAYSVAFVVAVGS